jgi:O-antigen/teichoic acid export membrane protein
MQISLLQLNIIANLLGNGWCAIMSIATIPIYIYFMGIESYGLIGIYVTLTTLSTVLDMGISTTTNREITRLTSIPDKRQEAINLVRSMEGLNWTIAAFIGVLIISLSYLISHYWIQPGQLTPQTVQNVIVLMGFSLVFQWPFSFYSGGLAGLQKFVLLNSVTSLMATVRSVGAILILWLVSPTIQAFFIWQIAVNIMQSIALALALRRNLPDTGMPAVFRFHLLKNVWRFAAGMGGITVVSLIMSQMDKFILSKLLSLETFGYYTLAGVAATSLSRLIGPLVTAIFPRFTQLITLDDTERLKRTYHSGCQMMSLLLMPFTFLMAFFSQEIVLLWTQNPMIAGNTYHLVSFLAIGTMFNGLAHVPLSLQYAYGRTRMVFYTTAGMTIVMIPAILWATRYFGVIGATLVLMVINMIYAVLITELIHHYHFREERREWYIKDVGTPLLVAMTLTGIGRLLIYGDMPAVWLVVSLSIIVAGTICAVTYSLPIPRTWIMGQIATIPQKTHH